MEIVTFFLSLHLSLSEIDRKKKKEEDGRETGMEKTSDKKKGRKKDAAK